MSGIARIETDKMRPLRRIILGLAIMLGLFFLVRGLLTFFEPSRAFNIIDNAPSRAGSAASVERSPVSFDTSFDAFHRAGVSVDSTPVVFEIGEDAPETDLNLTLKGRRASNDGAGSATLLLPDGKQDTFLRGETILRNVTLEAIYPSHIIISRSGVHERVTFERTSNALLQTEADLASPNDSAVLNVPQADIETLSQNLDARAQQALEGFTPDSFLKSVRPSPVREAGQIIGYRLRSLNRSLDLGELGLKSGDLVTHIGGNDLRQGLPNFKNIVQQFEQNPSGFSLTVSRDGQPITLDLN